MAQSRSFKDAGVTGSVACLHNAEALPLAVEGALQTGHVTDHLSSSSNVTAKQPADGVMLRQLA